MIRKHFAAVVDRMKHMSKREWRALSWPLAAAIVLTSCAVSSLNNIDDHSDDEKIVTSYLKSCRPIFSKITNGGVEWQIRECKNPDANIILILNRKQDRAAIVHTDGIIHLKTQKGDPIFVGSNQLYVASALDQRGPQR